MSRLTVNETVTVQTAMLAIDQNLHRSVIVVNDANVVVGTLSDGDVRRFVLDGHLLSTPVHRVMNPDFIALGPDDDERAQAIFDDAHVFLIPVIDEVGRLVDVWTAY
jgi:CBS domain-containing protein